MLDSVQSWLTSSLLPVDAGLPAFRLLPQAPKSRQQGERAAQRLVSTQRVGEQHGVAAVTARVTTPPRPCMLGVVFGGRVTGLTKADGRLDAPAAWLWTVRDGRIVSYHNNDLE